MADQKAKEMEPVETQTVEIMPPDIEKNQHKREYETFSVK